MNVPQQSWSPAAENLQQIASKLAGRAATAPSRASNRGDCQVRVIRDQEHESLMFELLHSATERRWIASHKLGPKAMVRLSPFITAEASFSGETLINYEAASLDEPRLSSLKAQMQKCGIRFEQRSHFHAKCVVADQRVMISSFNFLSADPFNNASNAREVGLLIEGGFLASELWDRFTKEPTQSNSPKAV